MIHTALHNYFPLPLIKLWFWCGWSLEAIYSHHHNLGLLNWVYPHRNGMIFCMTPYNSCLTWCELVLCLPHVMEQNMSIRQTVKCVCVCVKPRDEPTFWEINWWMINRQWPRICNQCLFDGGLILAIYRGLNRYAWGKTIHCEQSVWDYGFLFSDSRIE